MGDKGVKMFYPLKFKPVYRNYLWGGRNLAKLGKVLPEEGIVAESWEVSCHPAGLSIVENGAYAGLSLRELIDKEGKAILGGATVSKYGMKFPLLIKLIDANQKLSVQVHPDDGYALKNENEFGKHEIWYVISAKPGSRIIYGLTPGTTREALSQAIREGNIQSRLRDETVVAGDIIDISPGVVHALGEGIMIAEIQQNSNATYRLYDYDRVDASGKKRPLHVEKALEVIDFTPKSWNPVRIKERAGESAPAIVPLLGNTHFKVDFYQIRGEVAERTSPERFAIYTVLEGEGYLQSESGQTVIRGGESVLLPAAMGEFTMTGSFKALKSTPTGE
jgi:mannose-6-phosphate isomerase